MIFGTQNTQDVYPVVCKTNVGMGSLKKLPSGGGGIWIFPGTTQ